MRQNTHKNERTDKGGTHGKGSDGVGWVGVGLRFGRSVVGGVGGRGGVPGVWRFAAQQLSRNIVFYTLRLQVLVVFFALTTAWFLPLYVYSC